VLLQEQRDPDLDVLLGLAIDLTANLATEDRYRRLLEGVRQLLPCDAVCLLRRDGEAFVPVASHGLVEDAMGRRYLLAEHPRLAQIAGSMTPVRFSPDVELPDPFDGLLEKDATALAHVHACLGCPLRVEDQLVGLLTADALLPDAFADLDPRLLTWLGALAGAALHTRRLVEALEHSSQRLGSVARDLLRAAEEQRGGGLLGQSPKMLALKKEISLVAQSDLSVLITGETGTGKELVARAIHHQSARRQEPLIYVNCAALPESVAESELFGHLRGAFTGAEQQRAGKFEVADRGTLFLDEIGELPLSIQPKLLRALQEGEIQRVGADRPLSVDVRVLAATNRDLVRAVAEGRFRADLYHRLNVYPIAVPPLRERGEDLALLAGHFCDQARVRLGLGPVRLLPEARAELAAATWPGNVRELENHLFRLVLRAAEKVPRGEVVVIEATGVLPNEVAPPLTPPNAAPARGNLRDRVEAFQRQQIQQAVQAHQGNWAQAAESLGLHRSNLHHLARRLGLR
jgi:anaerobic nitric oxide reductase transcription regulator